MKKIAFIALLLLTGCASQDNSLRAQVDALTQKGKAQDAEIAHLKDEAAKAKDTTTDAFESAWTWVKDESHAAWDSQTSVEARARMKKCWDDLSNQQH